MVLVGQRTFTWDADNKPVGITRIGVGTMSFAYSGDGARLKKIGPSRTIRYAGGLEGHITDGVQVKHIHASSLRVATRVVGGINAGTYFTHGDHLGSLNVLTNSSGTEVQRLTYLPFGETYSNQGSVDFHSRRYTGQEMDPETGLYFYQARYYNPALGRFISPDAIVPEPGNPQSLNRFSYVENNPVNRVDPSGHFSFGKFFKALPAIITGIVVGVVTAGLGAPAVVAGMLGGAASGAVNTAVNGGNLAFNVLAGAVLGGIAAGIGPPLVDNLGLIGGAAATGAVVGAVGAAMYGGNPLEGALVGGITAAVLAAAVYGGCKAWEAINSPTLAGAPGEGGSGGSSAGDRLGTNVTDRPVLQEWIRTGEALTGRDYSGLNVYEGGTIVPANKAAVVVDQNTIVLRGGFFEDEFWVQAKAFFHELEHIHQYRTIPNFGSAYSFHDARYGYWNNMFEWHAEQQGAGLASRYLGRPIPPDYRFTLPGW